MLDEKPVWYDESGREQTYLGARVVVYDVADSVPQRVRIE